MIGYLTTYRDNGVFNYKALANRAVEHNSRKLDLPGIALETPVSDKDTGRRLYPGLAEVKPFLNRMQVEAMEQTPFDVTVFTDSDFFVASDFLGRVARTVGQHRPILALGVQNVLTLDLELHDPPAQQFPFWSTVLIYYNGSVAKEFFANVKKIREFWGGYARRFNFSPDIFRNDFAFSLALSSLRLPLEEITLPPEYHCVFTQEEVTEFDAGPIFRRRVTLDTHAMHKPSLLRSLGCGT